MFGVSGSYFDGDLYKDKNIEVKLRIVIRVSTPTCLLVQILKLESAVKEVYYGNAPNRKPQ